MMVLDTNVLSALMRGEQEPGVVSWLDVQPADAVWITAITVLEVRFGLERLPKGKRRTQLERSFEALLEEELQSRVLEFDRSAAAAAAVIAATRERRGRLVDLRDTQIAGIVSARKATLATRNTRHFADLRIALVNPWDQ